MSEIVQELREAAEEDARCGWMNPSPPWGLRSNLLSQAADEIERLQEDVAHTAPMRSVEPVCATISFDETDLAQLRQVREELRNRWRASAWKLLNMTIDDLEARFSQAKQ